MQTVLERPLRTPVELVLRRLDVATRCAYVTVAEFSYDGRFGGVADGGDLAGQLMDRRCAARPDVETAWSSRRSLYRGEQRLDGQASIPQVLGMMNGELATVTALNERRGQLEITARFDAGRTRTWRVN